MFPFSVISAAAFSLPHSQNQGKLRINYPSSFFQQDLNENCHDFVDSPVMVSGRWEHDLMLILSNFCFLCERAFSEVHLIQPFSFSCLVTTGNFYIFVFSSVFAWVAEREGIFLFLDSGTLKLHEYFITFIQNLMPNIFFYCRTYLNIEYFNIQNARSSYLTLSN